MENTKSDMNPEGTKCEAPETKSISEKVHEHLKNKNDHISEADIRNAVINPNENELETTNENKSTEDVENNDLNDKKKEEKKIITPWDVVDKNAVE
jgi:hypothetical protein